MVSVGYQQVLTFVLLAASLVVPAFAFEVRPNPAMTGGSVRIDGRRLWAEEERLAVGRWISGNAVLPSLSGGLPLIARIFLRALACYANRRLETADPE